MGAVFEEFSGHLAALQLRFAGRPRKEMIQLFLLALEREQLVSVSYRESLIASRLEGTGLPLEVKELIRHALVWAWKDEEMHAVYIRGALMQLGTPWLKGTAFCHQLAGALAGWSSSVLQHSNWTQAPLSRSLASIIAGMGILTGKLPKAVRSSLDYSSFREFCAFNVDAERTAWLCWQRLYDLASTEQGLPPPMVSDFQRIMDDEERHRQVFQILSEVLDDTDHLVAGESSITIAEKLGRVGETFLLPRELRSVSKVEHPIGTGGNVHILGGNEIGSKIEIFHKTLKASDLLERLNQRAETLQKPVSELVIVIKVSFMLGYSRKDLSTIVDRELLEELAAYLIEQGCNKIYAIEGPDLYTQFFENRSVESVASYFQLIPSQRYTLVDASQDQMPHAYPRGMAQYSISKTWKEADFRITFGKMRSHPTSVVYLTLGNMEWLGSGCDDYLFIERQAHVEQASITVTAAFPPHFAILDAYENIPDGVAGVMGCKHPKAPKRFYAGADALSVDIIAARQLGLKDPSACNLLRIAMHWFGDPSGQIKVVGLDTGIDDWRGPYTDELSTGLHLIAYPVYEFVSCRGLLFVPEMDEAAFPPKQQSNFTTRLARSFTQRVLGLKGIR